MFNQPIWPEGASKTVKAGYAARTAAETLAPGAAGWTTGIPLGLVTQNRKVLETLPLGYRFRQGAYGVHGKTPLGISATEATASRILRYATAIATGISPYVLKPYYDEKNTSAK